MLEDKIKDSINKEVRKAFNLGLAEITMYQVNKSKVKIKYNLNDVDITVSYKFEHGLQLIYSQLRADGKMGDTTFTEFQKAINEGMNIKKINEHFATQKLNFV